VGRVETQRSLVSIQARKYGWCRKLVVEKKALSIDKKGKSAKAGMTLLATKPFSQQFECAVPGQYTIYYPLGIQRCLYLVQGC